MRIIAHWIILSVAVWATSRFIGGITVSPIWVCLIVGACLTLFNMFLKPIINMLTLPLNFFTLGFFSLLINGFVFWYLSTIIRGFSVANFWAAFVGAFVVSILNWFIYKVFRFDL